MYNFMNLTDFLSSNMYLIGCIVCFVFGILLSILWKTSDIKYEEYMNKHVLLLLICLCSLLSWGGIFLVMLMNICYPHNKQKVYVVVEVCPMEDGFDYNTWVFSNIDAARELIVNKYIDEYCEDDTPDEVMTHVQTHNGCGPFIIYENEMLNKFEMKHVQS